MSRFSFPTRRPLAPIIFYLLMIGMPALLLFSYVGFEALFKSEPVSVLARFSGVMGLGLFAGNMLLSGRYAFLDKAFMGLDQVYLLHRRVGIEVFMLLTLHAVTMSMWYSGYQLDEFFKFIFSFSESFLNYGKVAYVSLVVIVLITIFAKLKYEHKKIIHELFSVTLFLGALHAFQLSSDLQAYTGLRYYLLLLVGLALSSFIARTIGRRFWLKKSQYEVLWVRKLLGKVAEINLSPVGSPLSFVPGQFAFVNFRQQRFPVEEHPFTLSSSAETPIIRISAKDSGDFTSRLLDLKPGTKAELQGPYGGFTYEGLEKKNLLLVAGGIGITPFMAMIRTLKDRGNPEGLKLRLIHSVGESEEAAFLEELKELRSEWFDFELWQSKEQGRLTAQVLSEKYDIKGAEIMLCGPEKMITALSNDLEKLGVPRKHIHFELFRLY